MPRTRYYTARQIVRFEPTREKFEAELPAIYGYAPHILEKLLADVKLKAPQIVYRYQDYFAATRTEITKHVLMGINYKLVKLGDVIEIDSPDFELHGRKLVVDKKANLCILGHLEDEPFQRVKISANSIKFLPPPTTPVNVEDLRQQFKVGNVCLITHEELRPRYEKGDLFKIVYAGSKYVRVVPVKPKFPLFERRRPKEKSKRINQFIYEKGSKDGREFYYSSSVYNKDIPYTALTTIQSVYGERVGNLVEDFTELGF